MSVKRCVLIKVEGSKKIGLGHVYRINNIIKSLKKNKIIIFTKKNNYAYNFFKNRFEVYGYSKNEFSYFKKLYTLKKPQVFLFDELNTNIKLISFLKTLNKNSIFLDNKSIEPKKNFFCIDTFIERKNKYLRKNYFYGYKYLVIDPKLEKRKIRKKCMLLHFGGTDRLNILKRIISYKIIEKDENCRIIIGPKAKLDKKTKKVISKNKNIKVFKSPKEIYKIYKDVNFAIVSGGITLFNIASLNIKNISISTNLMEIKNCNYLNKIGYTKYFGSEKNLSKEKFLKFYFSVKKIDSLNNKPLVFKGVKIIKKLIS